MTGTTTGQTALPTGTDSDDNENYLTVGLVAALQALANLFESATGHDHSGSGKGKPIPAAGLSLSTASNVLGADVALNNTATYFTGPSMAQGSSGTWLVMAGITYQANAGDEVYFRLTDGTSVFANAQIHVATGASGGNQVHLSAIVASPVGNLRVTAKNATNTTNTKIVFNFSGDSKDSSIWGVRIA